MISGSVICSSFKVELLRAMHNLLTNQIMIALYSASAPLSADTTSYITEGEISGPGYTAGGQMLLNPQLLGPAGGAAYATFSDAIWPNSTLTAAGALIYNQTAQQRAVAVINFIRPQSSNIGNFQVKFPPPGPTTAIIQLT
jgi:hypothetical protein